MASFNSSVEIINVSDDDLVAMSPDRRLNTMNTSSPRRTLLESVSARFELNRREREERIQKMRNKQDVEKAHSLYLKRNVASRYELDRARPVVRAWAQRNGNRRPVMTERRRQRLLEIETVDHRHTPVRNLHTHASLNVTNNADDYSERCPVIGCGVHFTNLDLHKLHHRQFAHSPCNPLLNMPNGCLPEHPLGYICPQCGEGFQRSMDCQEHMVMSDHLSLFSPLSVCGYVCPQCLMIFPEKMRCHNHMEELHHFQPAFPFSDDLKRDPTLCPRTVPVPSELGWDFVHMKARRVPFTVSCVECGLVVNNRQEMKQHQRETEDAHMFTAASQSCLAEVFAEYLGDRTCSTCLQILTSPSIGEKHDCTVGMQGSVVDLNCMSFCEFVRRAGLTLSRTLTVTGTDSQTSSTDSSVLVINSAPCSPAPGSPDLGSLISTSSSSGQRLDLDSPGKNKRVHHVIVSSDSSEEESGDELTRSACKKRKIDKPEEVLRETSPFVSKLLSLSTGLTETKGTSGETCDSYDKESIGFDIFNGSESNSKPPCAVVSKERQPSNGLNSQGANVSNKENTTTVTSAIIPKESSPSDTNKTPESSRQVKSPRLVSNKSAQTISSTGACSDNSSVSSSCPPLVCTTTQTEPVSSRPPLHRDSRAQSVETSHSSVLDRCMFVDPLHPVTHSEPRNLDTMRLIIFLDLDNWGAFFRRLPQCLPDQTFVWAFYGGKNQWKPPKLCVPYQRLTDSGCLHFHQQCGSSKDAADFAICLTIGKMEERLPKSIPFAILSGDKGFLEVERQMKMSSRRTVVIDPHNVADKSNDVLYALIVSVLHD